MQLSSRDYAPLDLLPDRFGDTCSSPKAKHKKQRTFLTQTEQDKGKIEQKNMVIENNRSIVRLVINKLKRIKNIDDKNEQMLLLCQIICKKYN